MWHLETLLHCIQIARGDYTDPDEVVTDWSSRWNVKTYFMVVSNPSIHMFDIREANGPANHNSKYI